MDFSDTQTSFNLPAPGSRTEIPAGLWAKCPACGEVVYRRALEANLSVCPTCGHYHPLTAHERIKMLTDADKLGLSVVELQATDDGYPLYLSVGFKDDESKYHRMKWFGR